VSRHLHLVVDLQAADPVVDEMVERLALAVPDATVCVELVAAGDTVSAGHVVARLALSRGPSGRIVAHDVTPGEQDPGPWPEGWEACFCVARSRTGVLVVGSNTGWTWAQVLPSLTHLVRIDVPSAGPPPHQAGRLAAAVAHVAAGHPHAVAGTIDPRGVPVLPHA
jgi:hypothetical protein